MNKNMRTFAKTETFKLISKYCGFKTIRDIIHGKGVDESFGVSLTLSDSSTKKYELFRFYLADDTSDDDFSMDLDRETLKGLADFIYNYLENN